MFRQTINFGIRRHHHHHQMMTILTTQIIILCSIVDVVHKSINLEDPENAFTNVSTDYDLENPATSFTSKEVAVLPRGKQQTP
jgi:hypothetical protein